MKKQTQKGWVKKQLEDNGSISRNFCLSNYVSRLGAIIATLKEEGHEFEAKYITYPTKHGWVGNDYIYTWTNRES